MQILECKKGHFFDGEKYDECPFCKNAAEESTGHLCELIDYEPQKKAALVNCFEDTLKKSNSGALKQLTLKAVNSNRVYKENFISDADRDNKNAVVEVYWGTTFDVARQYKTLGKVAVLNFANPEIAGGGVKFGETAQEECLCRSSNLYSCISAQNVFDEYYNYHKKKPNGLYTDRLIYTENVTVFKDDGEIPRTMTESEWFNVDVITCALPDLTKSKKVTDNITLLSLLVSRIKNVFEAARDNNIDYLILGVGGEGFKIPTVIVAEAFRRAIEECGYLKCFKGIIFAVESNSSKKEGEFSDLQTFKNCFADCVYSVDEATDYIGQVVNERYKLIRILGESTSFVTYLARDLKLDVYWAVKVCCKTGWNYSRGLRDVLLNECEMLAHLDHPAIPRIADVIENDECIYVVREYAEGETLEKIVKKCGAQAVDSVVEWAVQICDVLKYLHSHTPSYIYRDMKPSNVVLMPDGRVKIIDFGIMRIYKRFQKGDTQNLGTKGYAAPEQYGGQHQSDARTDIYGLGMTLYRLLTGQEPEDATGVDLINKKSSLNLHKGLVYIISKCIRKNPDERYQSCDELIKDLSNYKKLPNLKDILNGNKFLPKVFKS